MCSNGVVIDTTPPVAGYIFDGSGNEDAEFLPSTKRVRAKYQQFADKESPMVKYDWKIVYYDKPLDITPFVNIHLAQRTPLMEGLELQPGQKYKIVIRGTNAAGLQTSAESNGFIADNTAAKCNTVLDVIKETDNIDVDFVRELKSIQAKWKCVDDESGIQKQFIAIGTYPGGEDIKPFTSIQEYNASSLADGGVFVSIAAIDIEPGVRYHVTVKAYNRAGLRRTVSSDGIMIDTTPPAVALQFIKDGLKGKDVNYTKERFTFSVHWDQAFVDAESGLAEYRVGLGTKPGSTDTKSMQSIGKQTNITLTGLLLESGRKYYATVVGCNGVGMCVNASSNGALVDFVPPHTGDVVTGFRGPPVLYQWITKSVWARWNWCPADEKRISYSLASKACSNHSFYDIHSGINGFGLSVASLMNEGLVAEMKEVGRVRMSGRSVDLRDGVYSAVVEATDKAGMTSIGYSNVFIVDSTPPDVIDLQHGHLGDIIMFTNNQDLTFRSYFRLEDDLSKVLAYKVFVGSYIGADDVSSSQSIVLSHSQYAIAVNWTATQSVKLENRRMYYITVQAINNAGLIGSGSSKALIADFEAPKHAIVLDGWGMSDLKYQSYSSIYRAHWYGLIEFSGVHSMYLGLKSKYDTNACDVNPLQLVPAKTNYHVLSGLNLQSGSKYYACLKVVDNAGNIAYFSSNGILIDSTPPVPGHVMDGDSGQDIDTQIESSILWASWKNFTEKETEIVSYKLAFGTSPGNDNVQKFMDVGLVTSAASTSLKVPELTSGQRYYASVIALNNLGIPSTKVTSNGVLVDYTPPIFTVKASDGTRTRIDEKYTNLPSLSCSWECVDSDTDLRSVEIAFGLQPGASDVKNFTNIPVAQTQYVYPTVLRSGFRYFATVRCTNRYWSFFCVYLQWYHI